MGAFTAILATTVLLTAHGAAARLLGSAEDAGIHCGEFASDTCCHPEYGACAPGLVCTDNLLCEPCGENDQEPCDETASMLWSVTFTSMEMGMAQRSLSGFYGSDITGAYGMYGEYGESDWIGSGGEPSSLGAGSSVSGAGSSGSGAGTSGSGAGSSGSGSGASSSGSGGDASDVVGGAGTGINNQKKDSSKVPSGSGTPPADDDDDNFASDGDADGSFSSVAGGAATGTLVAAVAGVAVLVAGVGALTYARRRSRAA